MNEKFTPGPWMVNKSIPTYIYNNEHGSICHIHFINSRELNSLEESSANAALISAAPEMYKELERHCALCMLMHPDCEGCEFCDTGKVLKKARGEE